MLRPFFISFFRLCFKKESFLWGHFLSRALRTSKEMVFGNSGAPSKAEPDATPVETMKNDVSH